jgi:asparagine synthetase B (glutamine-hydrolysing)
MKDNFIINQDGIIKDIKEVYKKNLEVIGEFSGYFKIKSHYILYRDHIGCRKLFYFYEKNNLHISKNFIDLSKKTLKKDIIKSVTPGCFLKLNSKGELVEKKYIKKFKFNISKEKALFLYLNSIKKAFGDSCIVCLSGGLDSTIIASYAKKIFKNVILATIVFNYNQNNKYYEDLEKSKKISEFLKLKHIIIYEQGQSILKFLKKILYASQDWRDFNVHCASLNFFLGKYFYKFRKFKKNIILTGDFMNEFCADYTTESFYGKNFYHVPNLPKKILQRFFTLGLETSNREVGTFNYFGFKVFQPYNCLKDYYFELTNKEMSDNNSKYIINADFINNKLMKLVNRKKIRAQVGNIEDGGILGIFYKNHLTQKKIQYLFSKYFKLSIKWQKNFINLGSYKS